MASATGGGAETAFRYVGAASAATAVGAAAEGMVVADGGTAAPGNGGMEPPLLDAGRAALVWGAVGGVLAGAAVGVAGTSTWGANAGADARSARAGSAEVTAPPPGPLLTTDQAP
jgi:hypothetical protein